MRLVFCGSGEFAVPTLDALVDGGHEIVTVFTQPDRPAGRGGGIRFTPVKERALDLGISVYQPEKLRTDEPVEILKATEAELAVVVAYGHLIPQRMLDIPKHGFINLHASLLPKYRGAAPVPHAILCGEEKTGVTVFRLNEHFDEGAMLALEETPIGPKDTSATILERLAPVGAELVLNVVGQIEAGWVQPVEQTEAEATHAPKMEKDSGHIDFSKSAAEIDRLVRAMQPWPLAFTFVPGKKRPARFVVLDVDVLDGVGGEPGTLIQADSKRGMVVACGQGTLRLNTVKPEGKRAMGSAEYMRGSRLKAGDVLGGV